MSVIIFGNGPLPVEPQFAVMAPGSRTWQIVRTVADGLIQAGAIGEDIVVLALDETPRPGQSEVIIFEVDSSGHKVSVEYRPLPYETFKNLGLDKSTDISIPPDIRAVVGTGSVQPYSTATGFANLYGLPVWIDIFGDPICETQSQLELIHESDPAAAQTKLVHVWKLMLDALLDGDQYYALSRRQRHALQGQLGCAGRLNQHTAAESFCHYLPYAIYESDTELALRSDSIHEHHYTVMWCGSFNTWMDVPTLTKGLTDALKANPNMRLLVVGGKIAGYNEISYGEFLRGIKSAGVEGSVTLMDWQPLGKMQELYRKCDLGISIDRFTYEAELGSRTRLINFLASGIPVASTVITEISTDLKHDGMLIPFELGNAPSLTAALLDAVKNSNVAAKRGKMCRDYILEKYNGHQWGSELKKWLANPRHAKDRKQHIQETDTNALLPLWHALREPLGT